MRIEALTVAARKKREDEVDNVKWERQKTAEMVIIQRENAK